VRDTDSNRRWLAARRSRNGAPDVVHQLTGEWFPEERAAFDDTAKLSAFMCGRRAGKTRGVIRDHLRDLLTIPGYRGLYLNTTRGEAERLAWIGNRADGFKPLVENLKLPLHLDNGALSIHNAATDGWMYLRGADDEAELRKALGGAFHKVTWDEFQKIPPKLALTLREVFFPALLDFGGKFRGTGTPSRQMAGLAWDVTRPEREKRLQGWKVHEWNMLANPYWGREKQIRGQWFVVWGARDEVVSGPHAPGELEAGIAGARMTKGILALQDLYGGAEVAPIDSPIMQREGFGRWVREDAAYVYAVHKVLPSRLFYAPARMRPDGFPDIPAALADLPWPWKEGMFSMGIDIGFSPDPFAFVLHAWHPHDPALYEVASWTRKFLTSTQQADAIKAVREHVAIGIIAADAGGPARPAVAGWSAEFVERFGVPILEAEKAHKHAAIDMWNGDIAHGRYKMREGGVLYEEMSQLQWSSIVSATGKLIEDPTLANHAADGGLYSHRHSYQFRWRPEEKPQVPGSLEAKLAEEKSLEEYAEEDDDEGSALYH
jgi:hypothetical protein